ncbi:MAG TPA: hypothetical protein VET45_09490 [Candidatus Binatia bacterium]|nr:hypothetical protein [Candidatus Binatia bacterium]
MRFRRRRRESPEEARRRRLCRFMLELPPETVYEDVRAGLITLGALGFVLIGVVAWRLGQFATVAPALTSGLVLAALTPTVLGIRRRYRHVVAGVLVLAVLLSLLAAAVHRYGYGPAVALVMGPTASALADAASPR